MKLILVMLLGLGTAVAAEDIYRWVDDNGNQVYSDQPGENGENAEKIELQQPMTYSPVQIPEVTDAASDEEQEKSDNTDAVPNYKVAIVAPEDDVGLRVNNGNVTVNLQAFPALNPERGDLIQLYLDGLPAGMPMAQLSFMLENLDRGTHTLSAKVLNASGEVLAQSETITFHLQRTSLLNPGRQNNQTGSGASSIPAFPTNPGFPTTPNTP
ncbi:DUF4124 domain-containing protein [Methylophaga nitratireducenticrescens]|uniref:DUF4124 domain-containing protein n=1 Tax=Methylophaga nitratireducenticrescens TaxID=754476 RepID=UPI001FD00BA4|nr:DUF4124 domain-containing protein [Methylophaga nitratireducenticrescens]